MTGVTQGNVLIESRAFSKDRLQPTSVSLGTSTNATAYLDLSFFYCPAPQASCITNNGNMQSQAINPLGVTQTYTYGDGLNRLTKAAEAVAPTRNDPLHRTVELPKPLTQQAVDLFNRVFGR
jgi:hypothetical protein